MSNFKPGDIIVSTAFPKLGAKLLVLDSTRLEKTLVYTDHGCVYEIAKKDLYHYEAISHISLKPLQRQIKGVPVPEPLKDPYARLAEKLPWPLSDIPRYFSRVKQLRRQGWFKSMSGGYCDSHGARTLSAQEIYHMTDEDFEDYID